ncbi:hypothetical protein LAZ67_3001860 [Cordylochernes scorpioides]|uniref:CCHC-type domain-containing protein n=1 Tax=Cordylochernes scorpioides TaxID=51811 RepID=A0ABY6K908_9ARAC|nr:hypothetical protein LAZ67_3001860 [Cordylochernes scorpioides]
MGRQTDSPAGSVVKEYPLYASIGAQKSFILSAEGGLRVCAERTSQSGKERQSGDIEICGKEKTVTRRIPLVADNEGIYFPMGVGGRLVKPFGFRPLRLGPSNAEQKPVRHGAKAQPCAELSKKEDFQKKTSNLINKNQNYANPPAGGHHANPATPTDFVTASFSEAAAQANRSWADLAKKRRRGSAESPAAAAPSSNIRGAGAIRRPRSSTGWAPRAEEIRTTRAHIVEARARQASSTEDHCVYVERSPELEPFHYMRAIERMFGGTREVFQLTKMNGHFLVGLANRGMAERLVNEGLEVEGTLHRAFPFRKRAERITVGNLPFFVGDAAVISALSSFGRVTSIAPKLMKAGPYIYNDGRREAFIILREGMTIERLPTRLDITIKGEAWPAYLSSGIRCSRCRGQGHRRANCPLLARRTTAPGPATPTSPTSVPPATAPRLPQQPSAQPPPPASPNPTMEVSDVPPTSRAALHPPAALRQSSPAPSALPAEDAPPAPPPVTPAPSLRTPGSREPAAPTPDVEMSIVEETSASFTSTAKNATRIDLDTFIERHPSVSFAETDALGLGREEVLDLLSSRTKTQRSVPLLPPSQCDALAGLIRQILDLRPGAASNLYKVLGQVKAELRTTPAAVPPTPPLPAPRPAEPMLPSTHREELTPPLMTPPPPAPTDMEEDDPMTEKERDTPPPPTPRPAETTPPVPHGEKTSPLIATPPPPLSCQFIDDRWTEADDILHELNQERDWGVGISESDITEAIIYPEDREPLIRRLSTRRRSLLAGFISAAIERARDADPFVQLSANQDLQNEIPIVLRKKQNYVNPPAGSQDANSAAPVDLAAAPTSNAAAQVRRNWADITEEVNPGAEEGFTLVQGRKRRRGSANSPTAAAPSSNAGGSRTIRRPQPSARSVPRAQEIPTTRTHITEARARQASSSEEHCVYLEHGPELQPFHYLRALDRLLGGTAGIIQISKVNGHQLLGLANRGLAERLINNGLEVEGTLLRAFPFRKRAERITVSNLPFFVEDSAIINALRPFGRITSIAPKMMKAGPYTYTDGRREAFIVLHEGMTTERLPTRLNITIKGEAWPAYLSTGIKCSRCHGQGHRRANCPMLAGLANNTRTAPPSTPAGVPPPTTPAPPQRSAAQLPAPTPSNPAMEVCSAPPVARAALHSSAPRPSPPAAPTFPMEETPPAPPPVTPAPSLRTPGSREPAAQTPDVEMPIVEETFASSTSSAKNATRVDLDAFIEGHPSVSFAKTDALGLGREEVLDLLSSRTKAQRKGPLLSPPQCDALVGLIGQILDLRPGAASNLYKVLGQVKAELRTTPAEPPTPPLPAPRPSGPTPPTPHSEELMPAVMTPPPPALEDDPDMTQWQMSLSLFQIFMKEPDLGPTSKSAEQKPVRHGSLAQPCAELSANQDLQNEIPIVLRKNQNYVNPPAGGQDANSAAPVDLAAIPTYNAAAQVRRNWADITEEVNPGAEEGFTLVQGRKRRRGSANSPTAAAPSSNPGGSRTIRRPQPSAGSVPRAQEIRVTRAHIAEARARQASSSEEHCVYIEHSPELEPFHYLRALDRMLGGTAGVIQITKVNGHQLLGLTNRGLAERLISEGLEVEGTLLRAFPFRKRAERITVGNLPFFVADSAVITALSPFGRVTSIAPKQMKAGPYVYVDGRRDVFITLHEGITIERLPTRLDINIKGQAWPAYLSSGIRCSRCHGQGHRRAICPLLAGLANNTRMAPPTTPAGVPPPTTSAPPQRSAAQPPAPAPSNLAMEVCSAPPMARAVLHPPAPRPSPPAAPALPMEETPSAPPPVIPAPSLQVPKNPVDPRSATPRHPEPTPPARPDFAAPRGPPPIQETLGPAAPTQDVVMSIVEETTASSASSTRNATGDDLVAFIEGNPNVSFARTDALGLGREEVLDLLSSRTKAQRNGPLLSPPQCDALVGLIGQILDLKPGHTSNLYKVLGQVRAELTKTPAAAPTPPLPAPRPAGPTPPVPYEEQMTEEQEDVMIFKIFRKLKHMTCLRPLYDTGIDVIDLKDAILFTEDTASLMTKLSPALKGPVRHGAKEQPCAELSKKEDFQKKNSNLFNKNQNYANPPAGGHHANPATPTDFVTASFSEAAAQANRSWADLAEDNNQESEDPFITVQRKKRRRGSAESPAAAAPSSNIRGAGAIRRPRSSTGWAPRAEEIRTTRAHIVEARARQASSTEDHCVYVERSPELEPFHYMRAIERMFGGTREVFQLTKMNGHFLVGLANRGMAERLVNEGLEVEGTLHRAFPFRKRAERITVGNLPFFVGDAAVISALSSFGRVTSIAPKLMKAGPYIYNDGRREAFIILREGMTIERLPTRLDITIKGEAWPAYLSSGIRCSRCRGQGHRRANCPLLARRTTAPGPATPTSPTSVPPATAPRLPQQPSAQPPPPASPSPTMEVSDVPPTSRAALHPPAALRQSSPAPSALPAEDAPLAPPPMTPAPSLRTPGSREPAAPTPDVEMTIVEETSASFTSTAKNATRIDLDAFIERHPSVSFAETDALGLGREEVLDLLSSRTKTQRSVPLLPLSQCNALAGLIRQILDLRPGAASNLYKVLGQVKAELRTTPAAVPPTPPLPAPRPAEPMLPSTHREELTPPLMTPPPPAPTDMEEDDPMTEKERDTPPPPTPRPAETTPPVPHGEKTSPHIATPPPPLSCQFIDDRWTEADDILHELNQERDWGVGISESDITEAIIYPEDREPLIRRLSTRRRSLLAGFISAAIERARDADPFVRSSGSAEQEPGRPSIPAPTGGKISSENGNQKITLKENSENRVYANPPAGVKDVNLAAARDVTLNLPAGTSSNGAARVLGSWADCIEDLSPGAEDDFNVVKTKKRRRESSNSPTAAAPSSNSGGARSSRRLHSSARSVPRAQEIPTTKTHITEARARQASSSEDHCVYLEHGPELQPFHYLRALDRLLGGTAGIIQISKVNGHQLLGLANRGLAERLINNGLEVEGTLLRAFPFRKRVERITVGNLPFFVEDSAIIKALGPYGRITSIAPKMMKAGPYTYTDGRREAFIVLHEGVTTERLPTRLNITIKGEAWPAYLSSGIKCSRCHGQGHRRANCPLLAGRTTAPGPATPTSPTSVPPATAPRLPQQPSTQPPPPASPSPTMEVSDVPPTSRAAPLPPAALQPSPPAPSALPLEDAPPAPPPVTPAPSLRTPGSREPAAPTPDVEMSIVEETFASSTSSAKNATRVDLDAFIEGHPSVSFAETDALGLGREEVLDLLSSGPKAQRKGPLLSPPQCDALVGVIGQILNLRPGAASNQYKVLGQVKAELRTTPVEPPTPPLPAPRPSGPTPPTPHSEELMPAVMTPPPPALEDNPDLAQWEMSLSLYQIFMKEPDLGPTKKSKLCKSARPRPGCKFCRAVRRNWADITEEVNPGAEEGFTLVQGRKRRRGSGNSPTTAAPSSNAGASRTIGRPQSSAGSVPRAQEIRATRAHIADARARQASSSEEHCVYIEHSPELEPFHYLRALDRKLGGTAGVIQITKVNGHQLLGLTNRGLAERLISEGLEVEGTLLRAFPFRKRAERITVGNLPFFVAYSAVITALSPYGRVTSIAPKQMKAGPYVYVDGRRDVFITLHEGITIERLPTRLDINIKGQAWPAYLSSGIRCSRCHGQGHRRAICPLLAGLANNTRMAPPTTPAGVPPPTTSAPPQRSAAQPPAPAPSNLAMEVCSAPPMARAVLHPSAPRPSPPAAPALPMEETPSAPPPVIPAPSLQAPEGSVGPRSANSQHPEPPPARPDFVAPRDPLPAQKTLGPAAPTPDVEMSIVETSASSTSLAKNATRVDLDAFIERHPSVSFAGTDALGLGREEVLDLLSSRTKAQRKGPLLSPPQCDALAGLIGPGAASNLYKVLGQVKAELRTTPAAVPTPPPPAPRPAETTSPALHGERTSPDIATPPPPLSTQFIDACYDQANDIIYALSRERFSEPLSNIGVTEGDIVEAIIFPEDREPLFRHLSTQKRTTLAEIISAASECARNSDPFVREGLRILSEMLPPPPP